MKFFIAILACVFLTQANAFYIQDKSVALTEAEIRGWNDFLNGLTQVLDSVKPLLPIFGEILVGKRNVEQFDLTPEQIELLRGFWSDFGQGFVQGFTGVMQLGIPILTAVVGKREIELTPEQLELLRGFWSDFGQGFVQGFTGVMQIGIPILTTVIGKRDLTEEQLRGWNDFLSGLSQIIESVKPLLPIVTEIVIGKRDIEITPEQLEALRGFWSDFGQGFVQGFTGVMQLGIPILTSVIGKRDLTVEQIKGWDDFLSGLSQVVDVVKPLLPILTTIIVGKRNVDLTPEQIELLRGFWSDFGQGFVQGFTGVMQIGVPILTAVIGK